MVTTSARGSRRAFELSVTDRQELERMATERKGGRLAARRAQIILLAAEGYSTAEICRLCGCATQTVAAWRRRWVAKRFAGLVRRPRKRSTD